MKILLLGGSPCTFWSIAQKEGVRETTSEGQGWELFRNYKIIKDILKPDYFLYENNTSAAQGIKETIEQNLGEKRIEINSNLFSAQSRERFYVSNIPYKVAELPQSNSSTIRDILEEKSNKKLFYEWVENPNAHFTNKGLKRVGLKKGCKNTQSARIYSIDGKSPTMTTSGTGLYLMDDNSFRELSIREKARLQTIPDWYDFICSDTQSKKQIGNGWTIEVIKWFLNYLSRDEEYIVVSMYDGISCGRIVLQELGFNVKEYIAIEIDKYCVENTLHNFPNTTMFNDAFDIRDENSTLYKYITQLR